MVCTEPVTPSQPEGDGAANRRFARTLWHLVETVHAVTYFAAESTQASAEAGVRGFWRTYFGFRAAPLGACSPAAVTATFFGFSPNMVQRAVPAAWDLLAPEAYLDLRATSAAEALRRLVPSIDTQMHGVLLELLGSVNSSCSVAGRPLFAGNLAVENRRDPVEQLWQHCTAMREFRGDGHVAALTTAGLEPTEALCLFAIDERTPLALFEKSRGWSTDDFEQARARLEDQGLVDGNGVTEAGRRLRDDIEQMTDELAAGSMADLEVTERETLLAALDPIVIAVAASGLIPHPNPIGLPKASRHPVMASGMSPA